METTILLICPISKKKIQTPVVSKECMNLHPYGVFDLDSALQQLKRKDFFCPYPSCSNIIMEMETEFWVNPVIHEFIRSNPTAMFMRVNDIKDLLPLKTDNQQHAECYSAMDVCDQKPPTPPFSAVPMEVSLHEEQNHSLTTTEDEDEVLECGVALPIVQQREDQTPKKKTTKNAASSEKKKCRNRYPTVETELNIICERIMYHYTYLNKERTTQNIKIKTSYQIHLLLHTLWCAALENFNVSDFKRELSQFGIQPHEYVPLAVMNDDNIAEWDKAIGYKKQARVSMDNDNDNDNAGDSKKKRKRFDTPGTDFNIIAKRVKHHYKYLLKGVEKHAPAGHNHDTQDQGSHNLHSKLHYLWAQTFLEFNGRFKREISDFVEPQMVRIPVLANISNDAPTQAVGTTIVM